MPLALETGSGTALLRLEGRITLADAATLHTLLIEAITAGAISVDMREVMALDFSAIQLLAASARQISRQGGQLSLTSSLPDVAAIAIQDAGFDPFHTANLEDRD